MKKSTLSLLTKTALISSFVFSAFVVTTTLEARNGRRGGGFNRGGMCVAEMQTWRGRTLEVFRAFKCRAAMRRCNRSLDYRQSQGRNPWASCTIVRRGGGNHGGGHHGGGHHGGGHHGGNQGGWNQNWKCTAMDQGWEEHWGGHTAYGRNKQRTRRKALNDCLAHHGSCSVTCERD